MKIRTISLHQPWAHFMAEGLKTVETRHWPTKYRGPLAIHAAKRPLHVAELSDDLRHILQENPPREMAFGAIVCIVDLYNVVPTGKLQMGDITADELNYGNFSEGRYAWLTRNVRKLDKPLPTVGHQGFWEAEIPDFAVNFVPEGRLFA